MYGFYATYQIENSWNKINEVIDRQQCCFVTLIFRITSILSPYK